MARQSLWAISGSVRAGWTLPTELLDHDLLGLGEGGSVVGDVDGAFGAEGLTDPAVGGRLALEDLQNRASADLGEVHAGGHLLVMLETLADISLVDLESMMFLPRPVAKAPELGVDDAAHVTLGHGVGS